MNGVLNVYKPEGVSSFDVVRSIRKLANTKKVGHTGTLDPLAKGVLPICLGKATKIVDYIMNKNKVYKAELMLGIVTDTYDREGVQLENNTIKVDTSMINNAFNSFLGESMQLPPMYSALKVNGKRLYEFARQGITIDRKERKIIIDKIEINRIELPIIEFTVNCGKGTYIRSLCYDIGELLKCGGTMWSLERMSTGIFSKETSIPLEELNTDNIQNYIIPIDEALIDYKKITISNNFEKLLLNGGILKDGALLESLNIRDEEYYRIYLESGIFIGLGKKEYSGLRIEKLLV